MMNAQAELNQKLVTAYEAFARGEVQKAEKLITAVLRSDPNSRDAWHILGLVLQKSGQLQNAAGALSRAISFNPNFIPPYAHLAQVLMDMGQVDEALKVLQIAMQRHPRSAEVLAACARAETLKERKKEALPFYEDALAADPNQFSLRGDYAVCLLDLGAVEKALQQFDLCLSIEPRNAILLSNRGNALRLLKREDEALAAYQAALAINPQFTDAHYNLGLLYLNMKDYEKAEDALRSALRLDPNLVDASLSLGRTLKLLKREEEAMAVWSLATGSGIKSLPVLMERAILLQDKREFAAACADFEAVLALDPKMNQARGGLISSRMKMCDWQAFEQTRADICEYLRRGDMAASPFEFKAIADDAELDQICSVLFGRQFFRRGPAYVRPEPKNDGNSKIKIGYISADFRNHPAGFLIRDVLRLHDRDRFEVICVSFGPKEDVVTESIRNGCDRFIDIKELNDQDAVDLLRDLHLDVAVDLLGYTSYMRPQLFVERVAPVQINMMGFPGTMGVDFMDYIIADPVVVPPENRKYITEKIIDMPRSYLPPGHFHPQVLVAPPLTRAEVGLPDDAFVYCCFNNNYKITPEVFAAWMDILSAVKGSVLWLLYDSDTTRANLRAEATARGVDPARIFFGQRVTSSVHFARHRCADLFLDAWPYNAHTTTLDSLFMGLPVLTKIGNAFASRVAASLLHAHGLPELVTGSVEEYRDLAIELGTNKSKINEIRQKTERLSKGEGALDAVAYTRGLEAAFERVIREKQSVN